MTFTNYLIAQTKYFTGAIGMILAAMVFFSFFAEPMDAIFGGMWFPIMIIALLVAMNRYNALIMGGYKRRHDGGDANRR